ncbi:MAG TPA: hypothetical protein VNO19_13045 [Gemmatimonadales bacterium]|nr:hypothetical protein [Gemmatimonadales bacterium]
MIALLAVSLMLQGSTPTVGDTVWLSRTVGVPAGYAVRATDWEPADPIELLGRGKVVMTGDSARITYPVVLWRPGQHTIDPPGPLLLGPGGTVDSLPTARVNVEVRSVLPRVSPDSLSPQPRASLVTRRVVSLFPVLGLWLVAAILLLPLHLWWRRRGKPARTTTPPLRPEALTAPLARWADAGEYRAVANVATARLRAAMEQRVASAHPGLDTERVLAEIAAARPEWPLRELGELLRALDDVRFGLVPSSEALRLSQATTEMRDRLLREAA